MPSHEDYLDELLKNVEAGAQKNDMQPEEAVVEPEGESAGPESVEPVLGELEAMDAELDRMLAEMDDLVSESDAASALIEDPMEMESLLEDIKPDMEQPEGILEIDTLPGETKADMALPEETIETYTLLEDTKADMEPSVDSSEMDSLLEDLGAEIGIDDIPDMEDLLGSEDGLVPDNSLGQEGEGLETASDLEALSSMTEDDIEKLLAERAGEAEEASGEADFPEDDVLGMLEDSDDGDLQEIHQLLDRADNNEAVNEEITALLQDTPPEENLEEKLLAEDPELKDRNSAKTLKAQEKERMRQEKAAARKAAKEAKAAAKAAAKEAKAAAKNAKSKGAEATPVLEGQLSGSEAPKNKAQTAGTDDLFDTSILDSIVAEAEQAGGEAARADGKAEQTGGEAGGENSDDAPDFDIDSLFGDSYDSGSGEGAAESGGLEDFPDFVDRDAQHADNPVAGPDEGGKKKKGLLARFFDLFTEEDEEKDESLQLSDENREILNDLDKEKTAEKKKKKGKKAAAKGGEEDDKKGKKGKGKDKPKKAKKPKPPKPEKPKKEKKPEPVPLIPERKLSLKRVIPILLLCASIAVLIIVYTNASVDYTEKQTAQEAYYNGDYQTCFQNLYGKDLNETEQMMFGASESILRVRLWLSEYEMFTNSGSEMEALDVLIQSVDAYPELYAYAVQWDAGNDVQAGYQHLLDILASKYGLTESQALEIARVRSDIEYTRMVLYIVEGRGFGSWDGREPVAEEPVVEESLEDDTMPDALPEEDELNGDAFIDNQR